MCLCVLWLALQEIKEGEKVMYTYDVYWQVSDIKWASRWDSYLRMPGGKVHWFSIMNSILIVLVMATLVAMILIRTVRRDLAKYEQLVVDGSADMKDEAGWKLLTGDAFRAPAGGKSLAVHVSDANGSLNKQE
jgi:transmembrane 9 superfamily protein 2/4